MTPEQLKRVEELLHDVKALPPDEVGAFVDRSCGDDPVVRAELERRLAAASADVMLPSTHASGPASTIRRLPDEVEGSRIGPYKLLRKLGEGGMGVVYEAEQLEPVRRHVALKLVKWGMDTERLVARFESERQALAMMEHPSIARVFDAGATETGRPFFVMEYVKGIPLTQYCHTHRLSTDERLALFMGVCEGVQHAHQKAIIHRDLKPSNILVTIQNDRPVPKIIDFGVAKATDQRLTERTLHTELGQLIGTPEYMSPEQADMTALDVDTRTDVYSLGVILYELLVEALPFEQRDARKGGVDEVVRRIREDEPPTPSTRISLLGAQAEEAAAAQRVDVATLRGRLKGDLDWITMRAIERDRTRRYGSPAALRDDLQRHLNDEPVVARPPSAAYRAGRFFRRHRVPVIAASLVALSLILGIVGTTTFAIRAARQGELALKRSEELGRVADFQGSLLEGLDEQQMGLAFVDGLRDQVRDVLGRRWVDGADGEKRRLTREEIEQGIVAFDAAVGPANPVDVASRMIEETILAPAVTVIDEEFAEQPAVQAELLQTVGNLYESFGRTETCFELLGRALELRRDLGVEEDILEAVMDLGIAKWRANDLDEAERLYREGLEIARRLYGEPSLQVADSLSRLGDALWDGGDHDAGEAVLREALAMHEEVVGRQSVEVIEDLRSLADLNGYRNRYLEEARLLREAEAIAAQLVGEENLRMAIRRQLASTLSFIGGEENLREARAVAETVLENRLQRMGNDHPMVGDIWNTLGLIAEAEGDLAEAGRCYREAIRIDQRMGSRTRSLALGKSNLALTLQMLGDFDEAQALFLEVLDIRLEVLGPDHPGVAHTYFSYGALLLEKERDEEAVRHLERAIRILEATMPDSAWIASTRVDLGQGLTRLGRFEEAQTQLRQVWDEWDAFDEPWEETKPKAAERLVELHEAWHRSAPGQGHAEQAELWRERWQEAQAER